MTIRERAEADAGGASAPAFTRYGVVLLLLTAAFTFAVIAPTGTWGRLVSALLLGGAVLAALSRAGANRALFGLGLAGVAIAVGTAAGAASGGRPFGGMADLAIAGLIALVPVAIVLQYRRHLEITIESVTAALCIYVVLGMFFASLASAVSGLSGSAYFAGHPAANSSDYTYFSFVTLATVGYGDYVPALGVGRALAVLEGLSGQLYLVTVVALVVGQVRPRAGR
ncbi:MAG: two pore domain potassium channel family protein [Chloroflexi bacterium]|nr:MAG: two pore domain potassium channel family protein [Chloroflexota bacterium]